MKINQEMKRKIVQVAAFGYSNTYIGNFVSGQIYKGRWKQFCNPGMNCYSCPAARLACPIGAMQAVSGSMNFKLSFYVIGFVLALGVVFGRAICGFFCPFGLIQELIYKIPFPKKKLWKWLTYVKYVLLAVFVVIMPVTMVNELGNEQPGVLRIHLPGRNAGRWNSTFKYAPGVTRNTGSAVFCESMYFDHNFNRLPVCLPILLQSDVSAWSDLRTTEQSQHLPYGMQ